MNDFRVQKINYWSIMDLLVVCLIPKPILWGAWANHKLIFFFFFPPMSVVRLQVQHTQHVLWCCFWIFNNVRPRWNNKSVLMCLGKLRCSSAGSVSTPRSCKGGVLEPYKASDFVRSRSMATSRQLVLSSFSLSYGFLQMLTKGPLLHLETSRNVSGLGSITESQL